ncbi:hypothetical protein HBH64_022360 [Parastagonospora nodorum]|nr:hypothetical protein HBH52_242030 [Parastagonospora nodorum]KAH4075461.1 hypothetical protein HBH50_017060 [Parastagonospora nodorum]KAH4079765.1 hypothetical protein HBH46_232370 [Parastagonospora nodorum]KAH4098235.1 hypothetical protein HBH48_030250 [Parastagonospora nodorum]KAH4234344.1 hypothetical protein HBI05_156970 [Parastagonospora nodorum]
MPPGVTSVSLPMILRSHEDSVSIIEAPQILPKVNESAAGHGAPSTPTKPPKKKIAIKAPKAYDQEYLADNLSRKFATSTFDTQERQYLPEPCIKGHSSNPAIEGLVTKASVEREFRRAPDSNGYTFEELEAVIDWVIAVASKVFVIAVQCHLRDSNFLLGSMLNFYTNDFEDEALPINDPRASDGRNRPPRSAAFNAEFWTDQRHDEFFQFQWTCKAPVFTSSCYEYDLPSQCILPFRRVVETQPRGGSFSHVFKVVVHQHHQQRHASLEVAIKQITVQRSSGPLETEKAWDIEARALDAINLLDHTHIMKSLAAIRRGESRYFMFPWAEDSLRDYWNTIPKQSPKPELIREAIRQLRGLADALDHLHNFQGGRPAATDETYRIVEVRVDSADDATSQMDDDEDVNDYRNPLRQESIRHGDLKPENILRFLDGSSEVIGTLKLGDMGLAKRHVAATEKRRGTSMRYGTRRYEGPETMNSTQGRSRLYDLWSIGCITFEFIIWLLYGNEALVEFYEQAESSSSPSEFQYYKLQRTETGSRSVVHPTVIGWMDHIQKEDPECHIESASALKDLLYIVREKLLVVDLPPTRGSALADGGGARGFAPAFVGGRTKYRATAAEFRKALDAIQKKGKDSAYVFTGQDRSDVSLPMVPSSYGKFLVPTTQPGSDPSRLVDSKIGPLSTGIMSRTISADYSLPPLESWDFGVDNVFATKVIKHLGAEGAQEPADVRNKLCRRCAKLNFWSSGFAIEDGVDALAKSAATCDLCKLLNDASLGTDRPHSEKIRFERTQSVITITGNAFPILSLIRSPELVTPTAIQIGRPELPDLTSSDSKAFFELAKAWLKDCDDNHTGCQMQITHKLPTRLIDVGTSQGLVLRLVETRHEIVQDPHYIALSHPWGNTDVYEAFVTLCNDESNAGHDIARFKKAIPYDDLPKTFQDAVDCTRKLNVRYLWIDSICIIQGPDGDFSDEAKRMEDVYSGAYCVVAASRAGDQRDGFLGARPRRKHVSFQPEKPFYVCQTIDQFNDDVILGSLNQRGWVLQERALARRTIYFTENQTYFECGNGVRCETLTLMHNNMADFLGDPSFPDKAMRVRSRALKIEYFQGLYKQYSRLGFTRWEDRPVAIAGLEKRLQRAFGTKGRYGIFDDGNKLGSGLFHRSLLWRREWNAAESKDGEPLVAIAFPAEKDFHVPSWSWMAYRGGIDYTDPPFKSATWETGELIPPWTRGDHQHPDTNEDVSIAAVARDFDLKGRDPEEVKIAYDTEKSSEGQRVQCVIVARSKAARSDQDRRYYVLLVIPTQNQAVDGPWMKCKRVGAGFMLGKYITLDRPGTEVRIY